MLEVGNVARSSLGESPYSMSCCVNARHRTGDECEGCIQRRAGGPGYDERSRLYSPRSLRDEELYSYLSIMSDSRTDLFVACLFESTAYLLVLRLLAMSVGHCSVFASPCHHSKQVGAVGGFRRAMALLDLPSRQLNTLTLLCVALVRHTAPPHLPLQVLRILGGAPLNVTIFSLRLTLHAFYNFYANDVD